MAYRFTVDERKSKAESKAEARIAMEFDSNPTIILKINKEEDTPTEYQAALTLSRFVFSFSIVSIVFF
jgi:hypothetical protein